MSHWGSERGGVRDWECCVKRVQANERARQKRLRLHWMCWWCVRLRSHKQTTSTAPPPPPLPPPPLWSLCYGRWKYTGEGNQLRYRNCWKRQVEGLDEKLSWTAGCFSFPLLFSSLLTSRVRCGAGFGDINPEQRSLEARNERAETSFAITSETRPNASVRPTIVHRLLVFLDEAFRPKREKEEGQKRTQRRKSAATMFPQNRPPVSRLRDYVTVHMRL